MGMIIIPILNVDSYEHLIDLYMHKYKEFKEVKRPGAKNRNPKYCGNQDKNLGVDLLMSFPVIKCL